MIETLLFTCLTALVLCFFVSLAEDLLNPEKRRAYFSAAIKQRAEKRKNKSAKKPQ